MKFLYLILLSTLSFTAQTQNIKISTITWQGTTLVNLSTGAVIGGTHTLTSQNTTRIIWTKAGEIVYEVSGERERGTITFIKAGIERKIRMMLVKDAGESIISELTVSEFQAH